MTSLRSPARLIVAGGTVVTPAGQERADVLVEDGHVARVEPGLERVGEVVDATGCFVLPGGVDPHCHLMDGLVEATRGAVLGGTTTVLSFTNPAAGESDLEGFRRRVQELAAGGPYADVGLHAMLYDPERATLGDLVAFRDEGAAACKVFLAYRELGIMCSTGRLLGLMWDASAAGLLVQVHCEDGDVIDALVRHAVAEGRRGVRAYAETRPAEAEEASVALSAALASLAGTSVYLVHLSSARSLDEVRLARARQAVAARSTTVLAEVCLHHLVFDDSAYDSLDGDRYLVAPPLRAAEHVEGLWRGVADGTVDAVGSDHCQKRTAVPAELCEPGMQCCYGIAGVGARLPVLLSEGLARGVALERLVELAAAGPARVFGLFPRKGALVPGSDADIVVWDPAGATYVSEATFDDGTGRSIYAGRRLDGCVRDVVLRGRRVVADGALSEGVEPSGRFVSRASSGRAVA